MKNRTVASWQENGMLYTLTATPISDEIGIPHEVMTNSTSTANPYKSKELISVFEYLGNRTPESGTGAKIYAHAKKIGANYEVAEINTASYSGKIMLYERGFLDVYFNKTTATEQPIYIDDVDDDDLPF